jgi:hypothetical protein
MAMQVQDNCELLTSSDGASFEEFYSIYAESMPLEERKTKAQISEMLTRSDYKILLVKRNGRVIAFSVLFIPHHESFCLLEYIGVDNRYRNAGIGARLFQCSLNPATSDKGRVPMLLEVDSERAPSPEQAIRTRRKQFYKRLGCLQIEGLSYILPLPKQGAPPEMDLMVCLPNGSLPLSKSRLEHWLRVIYQRAYNCPPDDPRISQMMAPVADPVKLI